MSIDPQLTLLCPIIPSVAVDGGGHGMCAYRCV